MSIAYLFKSDRLGFRNWTEADIPVMAEINADPVVMEFFPGTQSLKQTGDFTGRMQRLLAAKGYCYFAVDKLVMPSGSGQDGTGAFIGFIGLSEQTVEASFTPCVDIGWRLCRKEWYNGFATEGATKCLDFAFNCLGMDVVHAMVPNINLKSIQVMEKISGFYSSFACS